MYIGWVSISRTVVFTLAGGSVWTAQRIGRGEFEEGGLGIIAERTFRPPQENPSRIIRLAKLDRDRVGAVNFWPAHRIVGNNGILDLTGDKWLTS